MTVADGEQRAVGVADRARQQHHRRRERQRGERERPPQQDERAAARAEAREHLVGGLAQDVGVVEARGEQPERDVEGDRQDDQHDAGEAHASTSRRSARPVRTRGDQRAAGAEDDEALVGLLRQHARRDQPRQRPAGRGDRGPRPRAEQRRLRHADRGTGNGAGEDEVRDLGAGAGGRGGERRAGRHRRGGEERPAPVDALVAQRQPLAHADHGAGEQPTGRRGGRSGGRADRLEGEQPAEREGEERREPALEGHRHLHVYVVRYDANVRRTPARVKQDAC